jgi:uncharacterized protein (DUF1697 family)
MSELRELATDLGYAAPRTVLNSGNLLFTVPVELSHETPQDVAGRVHAGVAARFGVMSRVTVLTAAQLEAIVGGNPLLHVADDHARLLVGVPANEESRVQLTELAGERWAPEVLSVADAAAYIWLPGGVRNSRLTNEIDRAIGNGITMRNWKTVLRLHRLVMEMQA